MVAKTPLRGAKLVVSAIRKLRDVHGTTSREIVNYINSEYGVDNPNLQRHVQLALKRGLSYGVIERAKRGYYLTDPNSMAMDEDTNVDQCCRRKRRSCPKKKRRCAKPRRRCPPKCKRRKRSCKRKRRSCRRKRKSCGGNRNDGDDENDETDEMAPSMGMSRIETRKMNRNGRQKFPERSASRRNSPSDSFSVRDSSSRRTVMDDPRSLP